MRHDEQAVIGRVLGDAPRFGQAADAAYIGLCHVKPADTEQLQEFEARIQPFAAATRIGDAFTSLA